MALPVCNPGRARKIVNKVGKGAWVAYQWGMGTIRDQLYLRILVAEVLTSSTKIGWRIHQSLHPEAMETVTWMWKHVASSIRPTYVNINTIIRSSWAGHLLVLTWRPPLISSHKCIIQAKDKWWVRQLEQLAEVASLDRVALARAALTSCTQVAKVAWTRSER